MSECFGARDLQYMDMGTNYYLATPDDEKLVSELVGNVHIAKVSGGWRVSFQSYGVSCERWPHLSETGPFVISSVAEVKALIQRALREGWTFVDEYDQEQDLEEFWAMVESHQDQRSHVEGVTSWGDGARQMSDFAYVSVDGYDFTYGEFF